MCSCGETIKRLKEELRVSKTREEMLVKTIVRFRNEYLDTMCPWILDDVTNTLEKLGYGGR